MPVDDRRIHTAIRMPGETDPDNPKRFRKGAVIDDPDELEKLAANKDSGIDLQALADAGAISGSFKGVKAAKEETETTKKAKK